MRELLDPPPEPSKEAWPQKGRSEGRTRDKAQTTRKRGPAFSKPPRSFHRKRQYTSTYGIQKGREHTKSKHTWGLPPYIRPRPLAAPVLTPSRKGHRVRRTGNWRPGHLFVRFPVSGILPKTFSGPSQRRLGVCAVVTSYPEMCDS